MKTYESVPRIRLVRRTPVIIRVDGKAFHTLTRGMAKPYDTEFIGAMWNTARALCQQIQGAQLAYVQSDEISVLVTDYQKLDTDAWFDNQLQKIVSVSASIATSAFTNEFRARYVDRAAAANPLFDSRAFNVPREDVTNYFVWRQQDATRNSIQMLGQAHFSHKELHGVSCNGIQDKLFKEKGINWNSEPAYFKRGSCVIKDQSPGQPGWFIDADIPVFSEFREYVESLVQEGSK